MLPIDSFKSKYFFIPGNRNWICTQHHVVNLSAKTLTLIGCVSEQLRVLLDSFVRLSQCRVWLWPIKLTYSIMREIFVSHEEEFYSPEYPLGLQWRVQKWESCGKREGRYYFPRKNLRLLKSHLERRRKARRDPDSCFSVILLASHTWHKH